MKWSACRCEMQTPSSSSKWQGLPQAAEDSGATVEQKILRATADQVSGAGTAGVRPGWAGAEHRDTEIRHGVFSPDSSLDRCFPFRRSSGSRSSGRAAAPGMVDPVGWPRTVITQRSEQNNRPGDSLLTLWRAYGPTCSARRRRSSWSSRCSSP